MNVRMAGALVVHPAVRTVDNRQFILSCSRMSNFALGRFTAAAIRSHAKAKSEMMSQLLLGEPVTILEPGKTFSRIRCCDDDFEGFVRTDQLLTADERTFRLQRDNPAFALDLWSAILGEQAAVPITFGARLPGFDGMRLLHGQHVFNYSGQAALSEDLRTEADLMIRFARRWLFVPGLAGGRTPTGIDPAALIQLVARLINIKLPRTADAMSNHGRMVDFVIQAQPADLAFFDNRKGHIEHVGLLLPDSKILHVGDRVRIDSVDHYGIFNQETGRYSHRLRIVKRLLPDMDIPNVLMRKQKKVEANENQMAIF
ncbi:NlpC/P60 family protein [Neolewinella aurantiaca]|uniref:NlpC/P60 family protein n=2 Tax=Neolewinella aurantiaca TaxID=2602767 RepID=A0A5C7FR28_9BACT|nr:NlpC/P60 family protein [Neolewinella aurantiaca]